MVKSPIVIAMILLLFSCKKGEETPLDQFEYQKIFDFETRQSLVTKDAGFLIITRSEILKLNSIGYIEWQNPTSSFFSDDVLSPAIDYPSTFSQISNNRFAFAGILKDETDSLFCSIQFSDYSGKFIKKTIFTFDTIFTDAITINIRSILETENKNLLLIGDLIDKNNLPVYFIINLDPNGRPIWKKEYLFKFGNSTGRIYKAKLTPDNQILLAGTNNQKACLSKIDIEGNRIWMEYFSVPVSSRNVGTGILISDDGNYIMTGYADVDNTVNYNYEFSIYKISPEGALVWSRAYGTYKQDYCILSEKTKDGGYFLFGTTNRQGEPGTDSKSFLNLEKIDPLGENTWSKNFGIDYGLEGFSAISNDDDSFTILGNKQGYGNSNVIHTIFIHTKPITSTE